jgi:hypothetical protein
VRERATQQFGRWLSAEGLDTARTKQAVSTIGMLLDLKADCIDSPDPFAWDAELIEQLLLEVVPRTVVQRREDAMDTIPILRDYLQFLSEVNYRVVPHEELDQTFQLLDDLEIPTLEAADDPARRSFSGNILTYALKLGIEPDDREVLDRYMAWYDSLPDTERFELAETGDLKNPSMPFDPDAPTLPSAFGGPARPTSIGGTAPFDPALTDAPEPGSSIPWFLEAEEGGLGLTDADLARAGSHVGLTGLARTALAITDVVGTGLPLTKTGALKLVHLREVMEKVGLPGSPRTMWDQEQVTGAWVGLLYGGWIRVSGQRVGPDEGMAPLAAVDADPEAISTFVRALTFALFFELGNDPGYGFGSMPDAFVALLASVREDGLTMPVLSPVDPDAADRENPEAARIRALLPADHLSDEYFDEVFRYLRVQEDMVRAARIGLVKQTGMTFHGDGLVLEAVQFAMEAMRAS